MGSETPTLLGDSSVSAFNHQHPANQLTPFGDSIATAGGSLSLAGAASAGSHYVGSGYVEGGSLGLRTSMLVVFWALLGFSTYYMVLRSTKMIYKNAGQAVLDVPLLMWKYAQLLGSLPVLAVLVIGGILGGLVTEFVGRRWR